MNNISTVSLEDKIKYDDECEWKDYISIIIRLKYLSDTVLEIRNRLVRFIEENKEKQLEFLKQYLGLFKIIFGGLKLDPENPFEKRSLSRFYYDIYRIGFDENIASAIIRELRKGDVDKVFKNPRFKLEQLKSSNGIISIIEEIYSYSSSLLSHIQDIEICNEKISELENRIHKEIASTYEEKCNNFTGDDDKIYCGVDLLESFLNQSIELLPQYNKLSWFLLSLYFNIDLYIEEYYPSLWKHLGEKSGILNKLKLDIGPHSLSGLKGIGRVRLNTSRGIGYSIMLIGYIFRLFQRESIHKYFEAPDFYKNYILDSWSTLDKIGVLNNIQGLLKNMHSIKKGSIRKDPYHNYFLSTGIELKLPDNFYYYEIEDWDKFIDNNNISAEEFFNNFVPFMMYGLVHIYFESWYFIFKEGFI